DLSPEPQRLPGAGSEPGIQGLRRVLVAVRDSRHYFLSGVRVDARQDDGAPVFVSDLPQLADRITDSRAVGVHSGAPYRDVGHEGLPQAAHLLLVGRAC